MNVLRGCDAVTYKTPRVKPAQKNHDRPHADRRVRVPLAGG